jgi:hypothetical protein
MPDTRRIAPRLHTIFELLAMLHANRRWWLMPMLIILMTLGLALVGLQAIPYAAPFIYSLF